MSSPGVMLLMSPATSRGGAFRDAAERIGLPIVTAVDTPEPLVDRITDRLAVDFHDTDGPHGGFRSRTACAGSCAA